MAHDRVLIVSDSPDRRHFLQYYVKHQGMTPIWYPNIFAARKALNSDPFIMVVVDLSIPVESKISLINEVSSQHPSLHIITLGKRAYSEKNISFSSDSPIICVDSIDSFPEKIAEYGE